MLDKICPLRGTRPPQRTAGSQQGYGPERSAMVSQPLRWFDDETDPPPSGSPRPVGGHAPPRGALMPWRFNSSVMARTPVMPARLISSMIL
jgi:hypothetical protein